MMVVDVIKFESTLVYMSMGLLGSPYNLILSCRDSRHCDDLATHDNLVYGSYIF